MAIQYSGNAQTSTFTSNTKQDIINNVGAALVAAGWTSIAGGSGTTSWTLQSATTPQGFAIQIVMKDNGGTCVTFSLQSTDGALIGGNSTTVGGAFLQPGGGYVYRVMANKYQAFVYATPNTGQNRSFAAFGVPYVPSWVASMTSRVGWMTGNAWSDTDTTTKISLRTGLGYNSASFPPAVQAMFNSSLWTSTSGTQPGTLVVATFIGYPNGQAGAYRWENGAALLVDALISWGDSAVSAEGKFKGQLWDACVSTDAYTGDDTASIDGHNWICVTDNNTNSLYRGTLLIATS